MVSRSHAHAWHMDDAYIEMHEIGWSLLKKKERNEIRRTPT
jgi:hypothetical protein